MSDPTSKERLDQTSSLEELRLIAVGVRPIVDGAWQRTIDAALTRLSNETPQPASNRTVRYYTHPGTGELLVDRRQPVETKAPIDEGKLWSFLRTVLAQGADIWIDHRDKSTELYSARMDAAARERIPAFLALIGSSVETLEQWPNEISRAGPNTLGLVSTRSGTEKASGDPYKPDHIAQPE